MKKLFFKKKIQIFIAALTLTGLFIYFYLFFYTAQMVYKDTKKHSDIILVLGARSYKNGKYNPCLYQRVLHAVNLYHSGYAPTLLLSGGDDIEDGANESETMKEIALSLGVPSSSILLEKKATSTYENILFSKSIMDNSGIKSVIIVTEPFHIARTSLVAKNLGLDFSTSPASESVCWKRWKFMSRYILREPFALIKYKIDKKI